MTHITVALPDNVAQQYYTAAEKLSGYLSEFGQPPSAQTLMRFMLSSHNADDIAKTFDLTLRNMVGAPLPQEPDVWVFEPEFQNAP